MTVAGEIDIATATRLRERLFELAAGGRPLVAGLDQVSFIDSAGLSALVGAAKRAAAHGGSLQWSAPGRRSAGWPGWTAGCRRPAPG